MMGLVRVFHHRTLAAALLVTLLVARGTPVRAQNEDGAANARPARPVFILNENAFRQMVYGNVAPEAIRDRFHRVLALKIAQVDRACTLSPAQRERLELAGKGDIKRHFDRIAEHEHVINQQLEQEDYVKVVQQLQAVNRSHSAELFGASSLFAKAVRTILTDEQAALYRVVQVERDMGRYQIRVEQYVIGLDGALGLSAAQRRRLVDLLVKETQPPSTFGPHDLLFIQYQVSRLPEDRLKPIFDDAQWSSLRRRLAAGAQVTEALLRSNGYLADGAPGGFVAQPFIGR
jgi:hypothetical protein